MLHKGRRCLGGNDMGKAGILLTLVAGIGTAVVFQDLLRLWDNNQFPADELLANELESTTALVTSQSGFRQINNNLFYRKVLCQFVNGSFLLPGMGFYSKSFFGRFFCLMVLAVFCFIEEVQLVLTQNIGFLLAGLAILGSLGIGETSFMCSSLRFSSSFSFCNASTDWVRGRMSSATSAAVYVIFLFAAAMKEPSENRFILPLL